MTTETPNSYTHESRAGDFWPRCPMGRHNLTVYGLAAVAALTFIVGWYLLIAVPLVVMITVIMRYPAGDCTCVRRQRGLAKEISLELE